MNKYIRYIGGWGMLLLLASCSLKKEPFTGIRDEEILDNPDKWPAATIGNYAIIKEQNFTRNYVFIGEFPSDEVSLSGTTADPLYFSYNYGHLKNQDNAYQFWTKAYQAINGCNKLLAVMPEGQAPETDQLIGENLFLRGFVHFSLCRIFGRPYPQDAAKNPGVPVITTSDVTAQPKRASVAQVYDTVINDLLRAKKLMNSSNNNSYASKEVAMALLSRVYLYKGDNAQAKAWADSVINSGRYTLVPTGELAGYFTKSNENNRETIWAIHHTVQDDRGWGAIGSMFYTSAGGTGYGEMYASEKYRKLLDKYPQDARHAFVQPPKVLKNAAGRDSLDSNGNKVYDNRNGYPKYFVIKYSNQDNIPTLSSPVILRLAEMYLNRAEANAKLGKNQEAIDDINLIRRRAGLSGDALYTATDLKGHATVLDVVLEERNLELAFETHRSFDLFRNNRDLLRDYPGTHLAPDQTSQLIKYTDPRVVHYIPEQDILLNPNLQQNP
jgi:hypothetical protein